MIEIKKLNTTTSEINVLRIDVGHLDLQGEWENCIEFDVPKLKLKQKRVCVGAFDYINEEDWLEKIEWELSISENYKNVKNLVIKYKTEDEDAPKAFVKTPEKSYMCKSLHDKRTSQSVFNCMTEETFRHARLAELKDFWTEVKGAELANVRKLIGGRTTSAL